MKEPCEISIKIACIILIFLIIFISFALVNESCRRSSKRMLAIKVCLRSIKWTNQVFRLGE